MTSCNKNTLINKNTNFGQGIAITSDDKYLKFDAYDVDKFMTMSGEFEVYTRPAGVNYIYSDSKLTTQAVINSIKPELGNKFVIAQYDAYNKLFRTYPKGPYKGTGDLGRNTPIDHFDNIIIISEKGFETTELLKTSNEASDLNPPPMDIVTELAGIYYM